MNIKLSYILFFILIHTALFSQISEKRKKLIGAQTSFGIQVSPILPISYIQNNDVQKTTDSSRYSVKNLMAYEFGMEIRHSFTKYVTLQSGINFIRRNYYATADLYNNNEHNEEQLKLIAYEIPIKILGFVRLGENVFMDISGGLGVEFYPSNIYINRFYGQPTSWIQTPMLINIGWEFRSKTTGIYYLGLSYKLHFTDMMHVVYSNKYGTTIDYIDLSGNYLSINIKYYFPQKKQ